MTDNILANLRRIGMSENLATWVIATRDWSWPARWKGSSFIEARREAKEWWREHVRRRLSDGELLLKTRPTVCPWLEAHRIRRLSQYADALEGK